MKIVKKILKQKNKPLFGNNRSFSNRATSKKFRLNRQKFQIDFQTYYIPVRLFRIYCAKLSKSS